MRFVNYIYYFTLVVNILLPPWFNGAADSTLAIKLSYFNLFNLLFILFITMLLVIRNGYKVRLKSYCKIFSGIPIKSILFFGVIICLQMLNKTATFENNNGYFRIYDGVIKFLPTTFHAEGTQDSLLIYLGHLSYFVSLLIFIGYCKINQINELKQLLLRSQSLIFVNVIILIIVAGIDRCFNLHSAYFVKQGSFHHFGPFNYRNNATAYFLLFIPWILYVLGSDNPNNLYSKQAKLIQNIKGILIVVCILSLFLSFSRSFLIIFICYLFGVLVTRFQHSNKRLKPYLIVAIFISLFATIAIKNKNFKTFTKPTKWRKFYEPLDLGKRATISIRNSYYSQEPFKILLTDTTSDKLRKLYIELTLQVGNTSNITIYNRLINYKFSENFTLTGTSLLSPIRLTLFIDDGTIEVQNSSKICAKIDLPKALLDLDPNLMFVSSSNFHAIFPNTENLDINIKSENKQYFTTPKNFNLNWLLQEFSFPRYLLLDKSIEILRHNWVFGIGVGAWSEVYMLERIPGVIWEAWLHCDPLELFVCVGFVGILNVILTMYYFVRYFCKNSRFLSIETKLKLSGVLLVCIFSFLDFPFQIFSVQVSIIYFVFLIASERTIYLNQDC